MKNNQLNVDLAQYTYKILRVDGMYQRLSQHFEIHVRIVCKSGQVEVGRMILVINAEENYVHLLIYDTMIGCHRWVSVRN